MVRQKFKENFDRMMVTEKCANQMMMNCLKRKVDEVFGEDNQVKFSTPENQSTETYAQIHIISNFGQLKIVELDKFKDVIQDVKIVSVDNDIQIQFAWNKKMWQTAMQFTSGNFISDGTLFKQQ